MLWDFVYGAGITSSVCQGTARLKYQSLGGWCHGEELTEKRQGQPGGQDSARAEEAKQMQQWSAVQKRRSFSSNSNAISNPFQGPLFHSSSTILIKYRIIYSSVLCLFTSMLFQLHCKNSSWVSLLSSCLLSCIPIQLAEENENLRNCGNPLRSTSLL